MVDLTKQCFLCDDKAITKEHIIPRWLQKHFNLENQRLGLWNNTFLLYKQVQIPLCKNCNGNILSRLEQRIQIEKATETDYYLWALKIRFLLSLKDTTLEFDRKDPSKGKLISPEMDFIGKEYVKHALQNFEHPGFFFKPNPFGSIFLFDNPIEDREFGFVDVPHPYWGIVISLPNNKILATLLTDRGMVKKEMEKDYKNKGGIKNPSGASVPDPPTGASVWHLIWPCLAQVFPAPIPPNWRKCSSQLAQVFGPSHFLDCCFSNCNCAICFSSSDILSFCLLAKSLIS